MPHLIILCLFLLSCISEETVPVHPSIQNGLQERTTRLSNEEVKNLDSLSIRYQLRGDFYAFSSQNNAEPSNGEWQSDNLPRPVDQTFPDLGVYVVVNPEEYVELNNGILGCKLYVVNTSDSLAGFPASDSRLELTIEAKNRQGEWTPISYSPRSSCGNSYHFVHLDTNEYWEFNTPVFTGTFKTVLRYKLFTGNSSSNPDEEISFYSNEIIAYINPGQLDPENREGHQPSNVMDPYDE